ncbi:MAG: hypothetical protein GC160_09750 [Acidobacteria bacterium]|nr:hypothetical protein [Acidobacteriota bacterium]
MKFSTTRRPVAVLLLCTWFGAAAVAAQDRTAGGVEFLRIEGVREFPEATEPGAIQYACAQNAATLSAMYAEKGLPFLPELVRKQKGFKACHIYYEPTVPGFRALSDDRPITGFVSGIHPNDFIADRKPVGDSLSVIQQVLGHIDRPLDVTLTVVADYPQSEWEAALRRHFPDTPHHIQLVESAAQDTHPWGQDYVKAGAVDGELRLMTPRRLYEGRAADGDKFEPLLNAFSSGRFIRSKLSWEGGDLQFSRDPKDPSKLILLFGSTIRDYWGKQLKPREFGWVLQVEFGADAVFDLSGIGPHTDYLVQLLPADNAVMVSQPVRQDYDLYRSIVAELQAMYGRRAPRELEALLAALTLLQTSPGEESGVEVARQVAALHDKLPAIVPAVDPTVDAGVIAYIEAHCSDDLDNCFSPDGRRKLLVENRELLRRALDVLIDAEAEQTIHWQLLDLVEAQLPGMIYPIDDKLDRVAQDLKSRGFKVIRVPMLYGDRRTKAWPGMAYANLLVFEKKLFVPNYGLGAAEEGYMNLMRKRLPGYEVIPVSARMGVASNGGVHCVFGLLREP